MSTHPAPFTWPLPAQTVFITGTFDNWSGQTHQLLKQPDGTFKGTIDVPFGEKLAYKYVVDGQWMTREDEAKEWDAAGNMNNVYTAPAAPVTPAPTTAATTVPSTTTSDPAVAPEANLPTEDKTEPESLVAAAVPAAATGAAVGAVAAGASGQRGVVEEAGNETLVPKVYGSELGAPLDSSTPTNAAPITETTTTAPISTTKEVTSAPSEGPTVPSLPPVLAEGAATQPTDSTTTDEPAAPLKGVASMFGTSPAATGTTGTTTGTGLSTDEVVAAGAGIGAGVLAAAAAAGGAVMSGVSDAVHAVTGVDLIHPDPEAKAQGIDTKALSTADSQVPAASASVPTTLPADDSQVPATSASIPTPLPEKPIVQDSIMTGPPNGIHTSEPAAVSTSVPQPTITSTGVSKPTSASQPDVFTNVHDSKDKSAVIPDVIPKSEHDVPAQHETKDANHKHIPQPVITSIGESTKDRTQPSKADARTQPISDAPGIDAKDEKYKAEADGVPSRSYIKKSPAGKDLAGTGLPLSASTVPTSGEGAVPPATPAKPAIPGATITGPEGIKSTVPAPGTPASKIISESRDSALASPTSTAPSTPAKKTSKESDLVRKRKSSFFAKVKGVFKKNTSED